MTKKKPGYKKKRVKVSSKKRPTSVKSKSLPKNPLLAICLRFAILLIIITLGLIYTESKGYFNPDQTNNHTKRKWDSFYDFTKTNDVDVLLLGNSHLYTGINPKNLSVALGVNSFLIASPGTNISDCYYGLKEVLKRTKPKLVVLETYAINEAEPYKLSGSALSDQFKSFSARKNLGVKLASTPFLFKPDNFPLAWFNTLRNHNYIFTNKKQIDRNIEIGEIPQNSQKQGLYLGRYVRFTTGLEADVLNRYNSEGSPVDGSLYEFSNSASHYARKIVELCNEQDIDLMFMTLPMHHQHIKDYNIWKANLAVLLDEFPNKWMDMQQPYDFRAFGEICFENTYNANQHMTYQGSLIATYKLVDFITNEVKPNLPNRKTEQTWHQTFYGQEGYFENNTPVPSDSNNKLIAKNIRIQNSNISEVLAINQSQNQITILAKINPENHQNFSLNDCQLNLEIQYMAGNEQRISNVNLQYDIYHSYSSLAVFKSTLSSSITITNILGGDLGC